MSKQCLRILKYFFNVAGKLFWSGRKLCPHPINFDFNDESHLEFIAAVANLHAQMYGLPEIRDRQVTF